MITNAPMPAADSGVPPTTVSLVAVRNVACTGPSYRRQFPRTGATLFRSGFARKRRHRTRDCVRAARHPIADQIGGRLVAGEQGSSTRNWSSSSAFQRFALVMRGDPGRLYQVGGRDFLRRRANLPRRSTIATQLKALLISSGIGIPGRVCVGLDYVVRDQFLIIAGIPRAARRASR